MRQSQLFTKLNNKRVTLTPANKKFINNGQINSEQWEYEKVEIISVCVASAMVNTSLYFSIS